MKNDWDEWYGGQAGGMFQTDAQAMQQQAETQGAKDAVYGGSGSMYDSDEAGSRRAASQAKMKPGDTPRFQRPEYQMSGEVRQAWDRWSGWAADEKQQFEKRTGQERSRMAASGQRAGGQYWDSRMQQMQGEYDTTMDELRKGPTYQYLQKEYTRAWGEGPLEDWFSGQTQEAVEEQPEETAKAPTADEIAEAQRRQASGGWK